MCCWSTICSPNTAATSSTSRRSARRSRSRSPISATSARMRRLAQGLRLSLQPRRPDQPHRFDDRPGDRSRHQLPRAAHAARGLPRGPARKSASSSPARGRSTAARDYLPVDETPSAAPGRCQRRQQDGGRGLSHPLSSTCTASRATALRLTNTYGPRMRIKDARQTFVGVWLRAVLEGEPFEVWGGEQLRDFTYVDDAVEAFLLAAADAGDRWAASSMSAASASVQPQRARATAGRGEWRRALRAARVPGRAQAHRYRRLLRRRHAVPPRRPAGRRAIAAAPTGWRARSPISARISRDYLLTP